MVVATVESTIAMFLRDQRRSQCIRQSLVWPSLLTDVRDFVERPRTCRLVELQTRSAVEVLLKQELAEAQHVLVVPSLLIFLEAKGPDTGHRSYLQASLLTLLSWRELVQALMVDLVAAARRRAVHQSQRLSLEELAEVRRVEHPLKRGSSVEELTEVTEVHLWSVWVARTVSAVVT